MKIYIDNDFRCHAKEGEGLRAVENDFFDGKTEEYINGYRFVPFGESWTREDGAVFEGEMISPATDYSTLELSQREDERQALVTLGAVGEPPPSAMAAAVRGTMERVTKLVPDAEAYDFYYLYNKWEPGRDYATGDKCTRDGEECVFKCKQAHTSQDIYPPEAVPALWQRLNESHSGTILDPIPADLYMEYKAGLYYLENSVLYKCTRDYDGSTGHLPSQLIGHYFEKAVG
jgi:hypothetical protein